MSMEGATLKNSSIFTISFLNAFDYSRMTVVEELPTHLLSVLVFNQVRLASNVVIGFDYFTIHEDFVLY